MTTADDARARILVSGSEDWVSLAEAAYLVRTTLPAGTDARTVQRETLLVITELAEQGLLEIGELAPRFQAWEGTTEDAVARIRVGWSDAEQNLLPGDVCWLATTPAGDALAEELWQRSQA